jgi:hypothetical protein
MELATRRILSPALEYVTAKSLPAHEFKLSLTLHQDRWPEVSASTFLLSQTEFHRKQLRERVQSQAPTQVTTDSNTDDAYAGLELHLGDMTEHFTSIESRALE